MQKRKGNMGFKPPVEVGEELDVVIEAVGEKGDGIAKKNGFVLFVPNAKEGETVRVKITKVLQKVGFADIVGKADSKVKPEKSFESEEVFEGSTHNENEFEDSDDFGDETSEESDDEENKNISDEN
jgi:predicted RNA-binding protein with TRAM domain